MDYARAIAKIDPTAAYLLNHSEADGAQVILEWRGPGKQPTKQQLDDAWVLCLLEDTAAQEKELARQQAIDRVKADPNLADLVKVLEL